ncbi:ABC transporter ATP-binding protein [Nocardiopsis aegyptia]|uniref:Oligopeptide/dipeptide ABC transporter ATP-binding protein n=1 Tax=Nocardiopsis aegyptia TaxID=220378 RepID=A0A7Z0ETJ4_9ACTN|nr:ABC transporter ATP-binding protein [Nocardiopsis aegyptia]NYJ38002.1 oligopeptide/dipeptide ABC transporter ATP-binding protein [Nocardiopsis aegyptia]
MNEPLLSVRDLRVTLPGERGGALPVVRGLSFDVRPGEALALIGESGAGKSMAARAVLGTAPYGATVTGSVRLGERELLGARPRELRAVRGSRVALIPQDALSVLSPVHTVGAQLVRALRAHGRLSPSQARERAVAALDRVGIPDAARRARAYPHEFSGGMRQRAVIAMATVNDPEVVFADEPTTALDPRTSGIVLDLLADLRRRTGAALVLITHDLAVVHGRADRVVVAYAGRHVESGPAGRVLTAPRAPYTAGLVAAVPAEEARDRRLPAIGGSPPSPAALPQGCAFAPRCPLADAHCRAAAPEPVATGASGHLVSCHRWQDVPIPPHTLFSRAAT